MKEETTGKNEYANGSTNLQKEAREWNENHKTGTNVDEYHNNLESQMHSIEIKFGFKRIRKQGNYFQKKFV